MSAAARLWRLISPSLPVGAYSFSQGLERVVESRTVCDEASARQWLSEILQHGVAALDLPVLLRAHAAWLARDEIAVARWGRALVVRRETSELRLEDVSMGSALIQLCASLGEPLPAVRRLPFAVAFAVAAVNGGVGASDAALGYAWSWSEAQVAAAIKLVPLGHTAGQRVLLALGAELDAAVSRAASVADDEIGLALPGLAIASAQHETQYTRLFRS
jgi:urease accessory protein